VFSLSSANRALVLVRRIVTDLVGDYARVLELQEVLELEERYGPGRLAAGVRADLSAAVDRVRGCMKELEAVGAELLDFERGVVGFPARWGGREVRFCWTLGEDRIAYWCPTREGLARRRHLSELTGPAAGRA
jgi:hypothetical protein